MKILYAIGLLAGGYIVIRYTDPIVKLIGRIDWAEKYLGATGTYTVWKIAGLGCIVAAGWALVYM